MKDHCGEGNPDYLHFRLLLGLNLVFAYCINLFNFLVTHATSPLTLQVLGAGKGALATFVSWLVFNSKITVMGCIGYAITISGIASPDGRHRIGVYFKFNNPQHRLQE